MSAQLAVVPTEQTPVKREFTREEIDLIKQTVAVGASDAELRFFLYTCQHRGLDPLAKQIHWVKRKRKNERGQWEDYGVIQTGIDGLRLIADRTRRYAPGRAPTFEEHDGRLVSATAYVMKWVKGTWHEVAATAYYAEYVQTYKENGQDVPNTMWASKPRLMLSKCAEAAALRRAFPEELSGLYSDDEMMQADNAPAPVVRGEVIDAPRPAQPAAPPPPPPSAGVPTKPGDLLAVINGRVEVPYDNLPHLWQALRNEYNDPRWQWPQPRDLDGWRDAYARALAHAQRKTQPAAPNGHDGPSDADDPTQKYTDEMPY